MATPQSIIPTLQVMNGTLTGRLYQLEREITVIGRNPDCDIVLALRSVSRKHAAIVRKVAGYELMDLGSTRGTYVDGHKLSEPVFLKDGNTIQMGELLLSFISRLVPIEEGYDEGDSVLSRVMAEIRIDDQEREKLSTRIREEVSCWNSLSEECAQIRSLLNTNHVKWDDAERNDLLAEVLKPGSSARSMLGVGFHRIVVLDAASGLGQGGPFDVLRFLAAAREEVDRAFGLRLDPRAFHIEDIFQMLKDEPRSLFCFANFQLIPLEHLRTVRSFTQGVHRVLLLTRGSRDLASEERLARGRVHGRRDREVLSVGESSILALVVVKPEAKFRALRLLGQELGGTLVLSDVLERVFNALFEIFPRAERGFVLLKDPSTGALQPQIIRSRSGPAGELKISKTVLDRVMNAGQAILSKNLSEDFPDSASVSDSKIRSLMCVPLFDEDRKAVGIMQIDTRYGRGQFEQDDLDLLAAVASQISIAVQNAQLHKALVKQREIEQKLQFARQVMHSLLPDRPASVPGYEFWAYYEPARHVGGDYYAFIPIASGSGADEANATRWAIAVGDVVGKGMPAALLTAKLSAEVRMSLSGSLDPERAVAQLNRSLDDGALDMYITFVLAVLDVQKHRLTVVNAGHPCPLILRRDGRLEEFGRSASGSPLGIVPDCAYESASTVLEPGETVILYTDGVTDAMDANGKRLGDDSFRQLVLKARPGAAAAAEEVVQAIQRHVSDRPQLDDMTLVSFGRKKSP